MRSTPIQDKLDNIKETILKDCADRDRDLTELAKDYEVSRESLALYLKRNKLKKCSKKYIRIYRIYKSGIHKSQIKDLRKFIKDNNITRSQIIKAIVSMAKDGFLTSDKK